MINTKAYFEELIRILKDSRIKFVASSLAYTTVLSLVPLVAVSLSLAKVFGVLNIFADNVEPVIMSYLSAVTGPETMVWLQESINRINEGALGSFGIITLMFIATKLLNDIDTAIQLIWASKKKRSIFKRIANYWMTIVFGPLILTAVLGISSSMHLKVLGALPALISSWFLLSIFILWIFKSVPHQKVKLWTAALSASITSFAMLAGQGIFNWSAQNMLHYSKVYGSLTSMFLFFVWILVVWYIGLFGVALNAALEKYKPAN